MNSFLSIATLCAIVAIAACQPNDPTNKSSEVSGRHNDLAARVNLGTAISLVVPIALGVALVALMAPLLQGLFASPIPFTHTLGYARKSKSLFSGINQESVMNVLDTVTKAIEAYAAVDNDTAKPKV